MIPETTMDAAAAPLAATRPRYARQGCTLTVREGLDEYRRLNPDLLDEDALEGRSRELFHLHDIAHVVFGCDTSIRQEALIDTWTIFGSDVGFRAYVDYLRVPEATQILRDAGWWTLAKESLRAVPDIVRVIVRARRMKRRWPWRDHEAYLDRPLNEVRAELGLAVLG